MRVSIKEAGFAIFFLVVIALVAVEAAETYRSGDGAQQIDRSR